MLKIGTVCSGIGSPEVAIEELGIEHENVFACEIDRFARASYLSHFKPGKMLTDMTAEAWEGEEYYSDLFIGGIPCQAFSLAGKRLGELDKRGLLFYDFYRYVKNQQPKVFIIENVKGLLSDNKGKTFQNWLLLLGNSVNGHHQMFNHPDTLGYNLHHTVLNAKDFGLPQNRERVFIVGIRSDLPNTFRFPAGFKLTTRLKELLEEVVSEKYYLSDKALQYILKNSNLPEPKLNFVGGIGEPKRITNGTGKSREFNQGNRVYDSNGIASTLTAQSVGGLGGETGLYLVNEPHPTLIEYRGHLDKDPRIITDGIVPTLRAESYGHTTKIIVNETEANLTLVGQLPGFKSNGRVYDANGLAKTIQAGGSGGIDGSKVGYYLVKELYKEAKDGDSINLSFPNGKNTRGRVGKGIAKTLDTANMQAGVIKQRIRKLTPLECWRLQGFPDYYFYQAKEEAVIYAAIHLATAKNQKGKMSKAVKGMSDSQLYKQAGNSMASKVMKAIIANVLPIIS